MHIRSPLLFALCSSAECDLKTARKWLRQPELRARMKPVVEARIARAAAELGIEPAAHQMEKAA